MDDNICIQCEGFETDPDGTCEICDRCSLCCTCGTFEREDC